MSNVSRLGRACAAVACLALLPVLGSATPASAHQLRYADAVHDVQKIDASSSSGRPVADPTATNGDIKDVFVHYRAGRLVIRANYVELTRREDTLLTFVGEIKTDADRRWLYQVDTSFGRYAGHDHLRTYRRFRAVCEIGHYFGYRQNFTRVVVPLSCLGNPRWVKVSVGAATIRFDEAKLKALLDSDGSRLPAGLVVLRADDASRSDVADQLRFTPRIYR